VNAAPPDETTVLRGAARLLAHCATLARPDRERPTARARLESEVGPTLARLLVDGLASRSRRALV
jgi:hypothetical protein